MQLRVNEISGKKIGANKIITRDQNCASVVFARFWHWIKNTENNTHIDIRNNRMITCKKIPVNVFCDNNFFFHITLAYNVPTYIIVYKIICVVWWVCVLYCSSADTQNPQGHSRWLFSIYLKCSINVMPDGFRWCILKPADNCWTFFQKYIFWYLYYA